MNYFLENIELWSQIAGLGSFILAIIALFMIQPIKKYYQHQTTINETLGDKSHNITMNGGTLNIGEKISSDISINANK